jgi:hypothetical protein
MTQRILAFLVLCCVLASGTAAAEPHTVPAKTPVPAPRQTVESSFDAGLACLKRNDATCAQIALAAMPPSSSYTKILEAGIAAQQQEFDTVLRLLIPLQADRTLPLQANASLHASLAQAYENRGNTLHALIQRSLVERNLSKPADIAANQSLIWQSLSRTSRETLLEMRGESPNAIVQGWIDLALARQHAEAPAQAIEQWHQAYQEHPATAMLPQLGSAPSAPSAPAAPQTAPKLALLLPLEIPAFSNVAYAVQAGLLAAIEATQAQVMIQVYPTLGDKASATSIYQRAIADGAQYVVGPLTRGEVSALDAADLVSVPTVALNTLENQAPPVAQLALFGLPVEDEARQLAQLARRMGMQSASVVAAATPLAERMADAFTAEWAAQNGTLVQRLTFSDATPLLQELRTKTSEQPADMIFLAANADQARLARPFLDPATPTYGVSHLYDGLPQNPQNEMLNAVHFIDMPWLINPADPEYAAYAQAAAGLPPGEAQRWFAVGVDAWRILQALADGNRASPWRGLTGSIAVRDGRVSRALPLAQFRSDGVMLEATP